VPVRPEHSWQHPAKTGFEASKCQIDWDRQKVICPMGKEITSWTPCPQRREHTIFSVKFREPDCRTCPVKTACIKGKRRAISVQERELVEMIEAKGLSNRLRPLKTSSADELALKEPYLKQPGVWECGGIALLGKPKRIFKTF